MNRMLTGTYDEALERLHTTGPEWDGWMSNHGPMAVDVLARRGADRVVHRWVDDYARRLEDLPAERRPLTTHDELETLGDHTRLGDWVAHLVRQVEERPWEQVLATWWPRLVPGIAAGATHGVIRTGHAVAALREADTPARRAELGHALGYWAARWQPVPVVTLSGAGAPRDRLLQVPRVAEQQGGIRDRLAQLPGTAGWIDHVASVPAPPAAEVPRALDELVDAVVRAYPSVAHGNPTMLVHAATAPHAVSRVLPSLPEQLHPVSYACAWSATAAVLACYLPDGTRDPVAPAADEGEAWERAVAHGGEHVLKLADTALDVHARTGDPAALAAVSTAVVLDA